MSDKKEAPEAIPLKDTVPEVLYENIQILSDYILGFERVGNCMIFEFEEVNRQLLDIISFANSYRIKSMFANDEYTLKSKADAEKEELTEVLISGLKTIGSLGNTNKSGEKFLSNVALATMDKYHELRSKHQ